jgi:hypothetical protein
MVTKILAWTSFATMLLFSAISVGSLIYWQDLGDTGPTLIWLVALPLLGTSILLAVALLVWSAFQSDS